VQYKRELIARALDQLRVTTLLEQATWAQRPGITVLTYHRIAEPSTDLFYDPVISATVQSFRQQIDWLHTHFQVLTLDEFLAQLDCRSPGYKRAALLTFDDGYRDNFDIAAQILLERNIPATFFISSGFLSSPRLPWWDHVAYVLKQTQLPHLTVQRDSLKKRAPLAIDLTTMRRADAIALVIRAFLDETIPDEPWFLTELAACAEVQIDSKQLANTLFMSWNQLRQLTRQSQNLSIGSHTATHRRLASLNSNSQQSELVESKRLLEIQLDREISALAYPYGWLGTYTAETKQLAVQAGYRVAFTSRQGLNHYTSFDRYELNRLGVGQADSISLLRARAALYGTFGFSFL
jgi:peptidoglycan/xylan/chitin deacetylase (PgdA/CDA1 family)